MSRCFYIRSIKSLVFSSLLFLTCSSFAADDLTPPEITEFNVSPKEVDVTHSSQVVTVTMRIIDNESGVEKPNVSASSNVNNASTGFGSVALISGSATDGIWKATLVVPKSSTSGSWSVNVFPLSDTANNSNSSFGPPNQFDPTFSVLSNTTDETAPEITEFDVSPREVDVTHSSQVVTVTMRIIDNESGVEKPNVSASSNVNNASTGFGSVALISGSAIDGIWKATLVVPRSSTSGSWSVNVFPLSDTANNSNSSFGPPDQFDPTFSVLSNTTDETAPEITEFDVSPKEVDVTHSSQVVTVTMRIIDNESGVEKPNVSASSNVNNASTGFGSVALISGSAIDGIWKATLVVPKSSTSGSWSVNVFPLSDTANNSNSSFGPPDWFDSKFIVKKDQLSIKHDTNGDGNADILWRNTSTGQNWLWTMSGRSIVTSAGINKIADQAWQIAGRGDFDGDGKSDILWRNSDTGRNYIYLMDGHSIKQQGQLNYVNDTNWQVAEVADLDGDGKDDVIWRHATQGRTWIYLMNGMTTKASQGNLTVADLNWEIVSSGDINGDDKADVIWRHKTRGDNYIWLMNGTQIANRYVLNRVASSDWTIAGAGDLNGDGTDDIIWRNQRDGRNWAYLMNGGQIQTSQLINSVSNTNWQIADISDLNGDGKADLFWRQGQTGQSYIYLMNGLSIESSGYGQTVSSNWIVVR